MAALSIDTNTGPCVSVGPKQTHPTFAVPHPRIARWCPGGKVRLGTLYSNPVGCGREGQAPVIIKLPTLRDEAFAIGDHLASAHKEGQAWGDMAVLCADWKTTDLCASSLDQRTLPHRVRKKSGEYRPGADAIQVMTMKVSKGLEFPVVALPGVGHMPAAGEDEKEAARVFYVAATRATQRLVLTTSGATGFGKRLGL